MLSAEISTASTQPRSALKRIMSGGRPPLDSPSPSGSIKFAASRSLTTLVMVGALRPEARTRSAREHELASRRSLSTLRALAWRRTEGLPTGRDAFFAVSRSDLGRWGIRVLCFQYLRHFLH